MKKITCIMFLLIFVVIFTGCLEPTQDSGCSVFELTTFKIEPDTIKPGDSVNIKITITNRGEEFTPENECKVGVKIVEPPGGDEYWDIPEPELIPKLALNGPNDSEFRAESKPDSPPGEYTFQAYIFSQSTRKEIAWRCDWWFMCNNKRKVSVNPEMAPEKRISAFESIFAIAAVLAVAYLIRQRRE